MSEHKRRRRSRDKGARHAVAALSAEAVMTTEEGIREPGSAQLPSDSPAVRDEELTAPRAVGREGPDPEVEPEAEATPVEEENVEPDVTPAVAVAPSRAEAKGEVLFRRARELEREGNLDAAKASSW
jgi:hypothetical protein